jgi:WD40 repeat protein
MPDFRDGFESLGRTKAPDLWGDIAARSPREERPSALRRVGVVALAVAIAAAGIGLAIRSFGRVDRPASDFRSLRIAAVAKIDGQIDVVALSLDDSELLRLTHSAEWEAEPAWSPDGRKVAFGAGALSSDEPDTRIVAVSIADGESELLVPPRSYENNDPDNPVGQPAWSPDGTALAFTVFGGGGGIYLRSGAGEIQRLTQAGPPTGRIDSSPQWDPDDDRILFVRDDLVQGRTLLMAVDPGMGKAEPVIVLSNDADVQDASDLAMSPDGWRVAFVSRGLYVLDTINLHLDRLTTCDPVECGGDHSPAWMPDAGKIIFLRGDAPYSIRTDGTGLARLFPTDLTLWGVDWRPSPVVATPQPPPDCGVAELTSREYDVTLSRTQGSPGTLVTVSGPTLRGEDGRWAPMDGLEVWWNDPQLAGPEVEQDATHLKVATQDPGDVCRFEVAFDVPDVPPGSYPVVVRFYNDEGYGWSREHNFSVISP